MSTQVPHHSSDWTYVRGSTLADTLNSIDTSSTVEHCTVCRAAQPDIVAARVRTAAVVAFARQLRLEVAELATLLDVPLPESGF